MKNEEEWFLFRVSSSHYNSVTQFAFVFQLFVSDEFKTKRKKKQILMFSSALQFAEAFVRFEACNCPSIRSALFHCIQLRVDYYHLPSCTRKATQNSPVMWLETSSEQVIRSAERTSSSVRPLVVDFRDNMAGRSVAPSRTELLVQAGSTPWWAASLLAGERGQKF